MDPGLLSGRKSAIIGWGSEGGGGSHFSLICSFIHSTSEPLLISCSGSRSILGTGTVGVSYVLESMLSIRGLVKPFILQMRKPRPGPKAHRGSAVWPRHTKPRHILTSQSAMTLRQWALNGPRPQLAGQNGRDQQGQVGWVQLQRLGEAEGPEHSFLRVQKSPTGEMLTINRRASSASGPQGRGFWESGLKQEE